MQQHYFYVMRKTKNFIHLLIIQFITNLDVIHTIVLSNITYLYLIFISATVAFWLDGVFIGSLKVTLLRNIMIISGILFFIVETILLQGNNDNLWTSFLVFFTARSTLLGIALHYHMKNNRFITIWTVYCFILLTHQIFCDIFRNIFNLAT